MASFDERIPAEIQPMLQAYLRRINQSLLGWVEGVYLVGSIALGAFEPTRSDVDFVAVTSRSASNRDVDALRAIHNQIGREFPVYRMEGSYLRRQDLGKAPKAIPPSPCFHDNYLEPGGHHNVNPVTWWMLKNYGLPLSGPPPAELDFSVHWQALIGWMDENLVTYWAGWTHGLKRFAYLLTDAGIEWAVLGVLRQFYTFREEGIVSKVQAGEYGLETLDERWHPLIREALSIRAGKREQIYRSRLLRAEDAIGLIRLVIDSRRDRDSEGQD